MAFMDDVMSLCKRRGFVYPGSDIYGGFGEYLGLRPIWISAQKNILDFGGRLLWRIAMT